MNLRKRLTVLEAQSVPRTLPEGEGKRRLALYLDKIAERQEPPTGEQVRRAQDFVATEWPAQIAHMRESNRLSSAAKNHKQQEQ